MWWTPSAATNMSVFFLTPDPPTLTTRRGGCHPQCQKSPLKAPTSTLRWPGTARWRARRSSGRRPGSGWWRPREPRRFGRTRPQRAQTASRSTSLRLRPGYEHTLTHTVTHTHTTVKGPQQASSPGSCCGEGSSTLLQWCSHIVLGVLLSLSINSVTETPSHLIGLQQLLLLESICGISDGNTICGISELTS